MSMIECEDGGGLSRFTILLECLWGISRSTDILSTIECSTGIVGFVWYQLGVGERLRKKSSFGVSVGVEESTLTS